MKNASFHKNAECSVCSEHIVFLTCNYWKQPYSLWDWWVYCANPTCENHSGEGIFQNQPTWVKHIETQEDN